MGCLEGTGLYMEAQEFLGVLGQYLIASIGCLWTMLLHWAHVFTSASGPWPQVQTVRLLPRAPPSGASQPAQPHLVQSESGLKDPLPDQVL